MSSPPPGIAAANRETLVHLVAADPVLVDCVPAGRAPLSCFTAALEALARSRGAA